MISPPLESFSLCFHRPSSRIFHCLSVHVCTASAYQCQTQKTKAVQCSRTCRDEKDHSPGPAGSCHRGSGPAASFAQNRPPAARPGDKRIELRNSGWRQRGETGRAEGRVRARVCVCMVALGWGRARGGKRRTRNKVSAGEKEEQHEEEAKRSRMGGGV